MIEYAKMPTITAILLSQKPKTLVNTRLKLLIKRVVDFCRKFVDRVSSNVEVYRPLGMIGGRQAHRGATATDE